MDATPEAGLTAFLRTLKRRWIVLLIPIVLVPCIAAAYALSRTDEYSATAQLLFRSTPGSNFSLSSSQDEEREAATNVSLASLNEVAKRASTALGGTVSAGEIAGSIKASADGNSNLLTLTATSDAPRKTARIANAYANEFVAYRQSTDRDAVRAAQRRTQRRLDAVGSELGRLRGQENGRVTELQAERRRLLKDAQDFNSLETLASGNVQIAQRADVPGATSSQPASRIVLIGLVIGVILGVGLALLFDLLDRRLRDPDEVENVFKRPLLGAIPLSPALVRNNRGRRVRGERRGLGPAEIEAFHMLRANLQYFELDEPIRSVVVTSAQPGDGKSTVAWNLAAANANAGGKTLLIEAELRRPTLVREFRLESTQGLSEILAGVVEPSEVVQRLHAGPASGDGSEAPAMDVLVAGAIPPNPTDLLESPRMEALIRAAEEEYDLVVIDTPPVAIVSDAIPLLKRAGGVIVVTLLGQTGREAARHLTKQLASLHANVLGVVVNGVTSDDGYYGQAYGYAERYEATSVAG